MPALWKKKGGPSRPTMGSRGDTLFHYFVAGVAGSVLVLIWMLVASLFIDAGESIDRYGTSFLTSTTWDPSKELYTSLPFIFGTLMTSGIALLIGVPLSVGIAICLSELAPGWLREPLSFMIELLAAVPSVIYGLWAMYTLRPVLVEHIEPFLISSLGWTPFFEGSAFGIDKLAAGVILAVMIIPTVASVSKETMMAVPESQREAALSLGATRYETTRMAVLTYARSGIFGAAILGLGRAIGETMAVTMTIGNSNTISWSLLDPGQTMASVIANNWGEADDLFLSALIEIGAVLFVVALLVNVAARLMVGRFMKAVPMTGGGL
ncbi:MAG: phosphate ABC transporter permease subunit PstC [Thermoplasmata archaeon]|jgi:phosphate transport system permease protein|nr:phosphate ABC transporter permease subunit PstC [Thermoplasmata archaeon]